MKWPQEHVKLLQDLYPVLPKEDLLKILPYSIGQIKSAASNLKLKKKGKLLSWRYEDELKLAELYSNTLNAELAVRFNVSESKVAGAAFKLGLHKTKEFMRFHALKTAFPRGHQPENKGKKQVDYMSAEQIEKTKNTRFKKGQASINELPDGVITTRFSKSTDGRKRQPQQYIRLAKSNWKELQIYNWEKLNGPVPKGSVLACKDGDRMNCEADNWEPISKRENMKRNSAVYNMPDKYIAGLLARKGRKADHDARDIYIQQPELIELKRNQIKLQRAIKDHGNKN